MNASTVVVMTALGAGVLIDLPGLRYEVPFAGEPGPMEWDLRWYGFTEPEVEVLVLDGRSGIGATLSPEWRKGMEVWDLEILQRRLEHGGATEPEPLIQFLEPRTSSVPLIIEGTQDPGISRLFVDVEGDLRPDKYWPPPPFFRLNEPLLSQPQVKDTATWEQLIEEQLRLRTNEWEYFYADSGEPAYHKRLLDPSSGDSLLTVPLSSEEETVQSLFSVHSDDGPRWIALEGVVTRDSETGMMIFEIDLSQIPAQLHIDRFIAKIRTGGFLGYPAESAAETIVTLVRIQESRLPGDFNRDGTLTLADLSAYSAAFAAEAPRADLNRDGRVDAEDLRIYLATFEANFRP